MLRNLIFKSHKLLYVRRTKVRLFIMLTFIFRKMQLFLCKLLKFFWGYDKIKCIAFI